MVIDWWLADIHRWKVGVSDHGVFLVSRASGSGHSCFCSLVEQLSDLAGPAGRGLTLVSGAVTIPRGRREMLVR